MLPPSHQGFSTQSKECRRAVKGRAASDTKCDWAYGLIVSYATPCGEYITERVFSLSLYGDGTIVRGDDAMMGERGVGGGLMGRSM